MSRCTQIKEKTHTKKRRETKPYRIRSRSPFSNLESKLMSQIDTPSRRQRCTTQFDYNGKSDKFPIEELKIYCNSLPLPRTAGTIPVVETEIPKDAKGKLFDLLTGTDITNKLFYSRFTVDWREQHLQVVPGVNFLATCKNYECSMYLENVICPKGLYLERNGYCSMDSEIFKIKCPVCRKRISPDRSIGIGFFRCAFKVSYMLRASKHRSVEMRATGETLMLAKCSKPNDEMFLYLELRLSPI